MIRRRSPSLAAAQRRPLLRASRYRILRDPHRAQDATQQALLGAWRDLPTLRDPERFDAWLHRLVVNACYAEARGERRWTARIRVIPIETTVESRRGALVSPHGTNSTRPSAG